MDNVTSNSETNIPSTESSKPEEQQIKNMPQSYSVKMDNVTSNSETNIPSTETSKPEEQPTKTMPQLNNLAMSSTLLAIQQQLINKLNETSYTEYSKRHNIPESPMHESESLISDPLILNPSTTTSMTPASMTPAPMIPMAPMTPASADINIIPKLQNVVSTANLGCKLNLRQIAQTAKNSEYNPKRFCALIMRIREPRTTALIFTSGKIVCTGAKSERDSRLAARKYARIVQNLNFPATFFDFKVQNIVGSIDVEFPICLEGISLAHYPFSSYEPELFPGLIYRMMKPRVVLLIFMSGKIVLTGAKDRQEIYAAFRNIYPILKNFRSK